MIKNQLGATNMFWRFLTRSCRVGTSPGQETSSHCVT